MPAHRRSLIRLRQLVIIPFCGAEEFEEAANAGAATAEAPAAAAAPKKERREIFFDMTYSPFILISKVWQSLHSRRGLPLTLWQLVQFCSPR